MRIKWDTVDLKSEVSYEDYKKTWQEIPNAFLHYLYNI